MIKDCLDAFKRLYGTEEEINQLIADNYILAEGTYIIVYNYVDYKVIEIDKENQKDITNDYYKYLTERDYLSKLLDMNKPIDPKKQIHSNNYLTFFIKKDKIKDIKEEVIINYYKILKKPINKYKNDKNKKQLYEKIEKKEGKPDIEQIDKCFKWVKENLNKLLSEIKNDKNYLKIFFEESIDIYKKESNKYLIPNLYNSNDYNITSDEITFGVPNDNLNLNTKKPYLKNKSRKNESPYLIDSNEVKNQKKFFDYLYIQACEKKNNIYIGKDKIYALKQEESIFNEEPQFNGYYLRIAKGKEVEIQDYDIVSLDNNLLKNFETKKILNVDIPKDKAKLEYKKVIEMKTLIHMINAIFFDKTLINNLFTEAKDISIRDSKLKSILLTSRKNFFDWFYKGRINGIKSKFDNISIKLIINSIIKGYYYKACEQFNLRQAILQYLEGGKEMNYDKVVSTLREKINSRTTLKIESDDEYYFAVGQILNYFISKNKSNKKTHSLINPILNCKSDNLLKEKIEKLFKKYNYDIGINSKRFNNMGAMVLSYPPHQKTNVNNTILLAGYLSSSLIYEKTEGDEEIE